VVIALLLLGNVAVRSCRADEAVPVDVVEMSSFEAEADSAVADYPKGSSSRKHDADKKRRKSGSSKKKSKPERKQSPAPRRMDPVPQF
jgi:hypothetical protein